MALKKVMTLTKAERKKLERYHTRAKKVERDSKKLASDVGKELKKQMRKS